MAEGNKITDSINAIDNNSNASAQDIKEIAQDPNVGAGLGVGQDQIQNPIGDIDVLESDSRMFLDNLAFDEVTLKRFTLSQPGRGYIIPVSNVKFLEKLVPKSMDLFVSLLIAFAVDVQGISDPTLNMSNVNTGVESQNMKVANNWSSLGEEIQVKFPADLRGQFLLRFHHLWATGIQEINDDRGTYHGLAGRTDAGLLPHSNANHTMSWLYFTVDPSETTIESCYYILNVMPTNLLHSMNNKTRGEHSPLEANYSYSCQIISGINNSTILGKCYEYLSAVNAKRNVASSIQAEYKTLAEKELV